MAAVLTLLATLMMALLATRIGAVALMLTGLSQEVARFQARSAFTGVGFTTNEAESVVNHPVRRKILAVLMLGGNIGVAAVIASVIASFANVSNVADDKGDWHSFWIYMLQIAILLLGLMTMWLVFTSRWVDKTISRVIEKALLKWTSLDVRDYVALLHLANGYVVVELQIDEGDWVAEKPLLDCRLSDEGVLVLGINRRGGKYIGSPNGHTIVKAGDVLSLYGPIDRLEELDLRKQGYMGDRAHRIAVKAQYEVDREDQLEDPDSPDPDEQTAGS